MRKFLSNVWLVALAAAGLAVVFVYLVVEDEQDWVDGCDVEPCGRVQQRIVGVPELLCHWAGLSQCRDRQDSP